MYNPEVEEKDGDGAKSVSCVATEPRPQASPLQSANIEVVQVGRA